MTSDAGEVPAFRFETRLPLRHTDSFGGTPFVHGGVLLALSEIALAGYDRYAGVPSHRDVLRFQTHTEARYIAPLRWDDAALVRLRAEVLTPGRLAFEVEIAAASDGHVVARMTHRYAYVNAETGRAQTPEDWPQIVAAIEAFEGSAGATRAPSGGRA